MNPGANFETSVVGPLEILVALVNRQIGQSYSNSGRFAITTFMSPLFAIISNLEMETQPKRLWII